MSTRNSARKRTPPSPAKFSPSYRAGISPNMAPLKRLDTSESPASRQSRLSCPIETHLSMRGAASSSRIGPNAEASSSKKRGGRLSSAQRGFLSALGNTGRKTKSSTMPLHATTSNTSMNGESNTTTNTTTTTTTTTNGLPPRSPYRAPVPKFNESTNNNTTTSSIQQRDTDVVMGGTGAKSPARNTAVPAPITSSSPIMQKIDRKKVSVRRTSGSSSGAKWPRAEDECLRKLIEQFGDSDWNAVSIRMEISHRSEQECQARWIKIRNHTRGPWTPDEDQRMITLVASMGGAGKIKWSAVAEKLPGRVGKQCRERWFNHLDPSVKKGDWTSEEDDIIFEMQKQRGNKWSEIARLVPGRSENAVKNRWNSSARRKWYESRDMEDPGTPRSNGSRPNTPKSTSSTASSTSKKSSSNLKRETTTYQQRQNNNANRSSFDFSSSSSSSSTFVPAPSSTTSPAIAPAPIAPSSSNRRPILSKPPPNQAAMMAFMSQQAAFQASMMAAQQNKNRNNNNKSGMNNGSPPMPPMMPMMPPLLMQQMLSGKLPAKGLPGMNPEMIKLMKMQVQMMQQMQKVQQQRKGKSKNGGQTPIMPMPPMMPFMPGMMSSGGSGSGGKQKNKGSTKIKKKRGSGRKKKTNSKQQQQQQLYQQFDPNNMDLPSPLGSPDRRKGDYDLFGDSPISADDLQSLLSPNSSTSMDGRNPLGGGGNRRGRNNNAQLKLSPRASETGSDIGGVDFLGDLDQFLADYKDDEGLLVDTLDRVNLEDDLVPFELQPDNHHQHHQHHQQHQQQQQQQNQNRSTLSSNNLHRTSTTNNSQQQQQHLRHNSSASSMNSQHSMRSQMSMESMGAMSMGSMDGYVDQMNTDGNEMAPPPQREGRKKKSRPKLEQMPSDAFPLHSMPGMPGSLDPVSPFTSSFEWANQEGGSSIPNSMTTPKGNQAFPLSSPTNIFSPGGTNLAMDLEVDDDL